MLGTLQHLIVHKLSEQPLSGYSLSKEIEKSTGKKPSFGSIYPLLERLSKDGVVTVTIEGRKKVYHLTAKGKTVAQEYKKNHHEIIEQMIAQTKACNEISNLNMTPMIEYLERLREGEDPLGQVHHNAIAMRDLMLEMAMLGHVQHHHKEINLILEDAIKKLKRIKQKA